MWIYDQNKFFCFREVELEPKNRPDEYKLMKDESWFKVSLFIRTVQIAQSLT